MERKHESQMIQEEIDQEAARRLSTQGDVEEGLAKAIDLVDRHTQAVDFDVALDYMRAALAELQALRREKAEDEWVCWADEPPPTGRQILVCMEEGGPFTVHYSEKGMAQFKDTTPTTWMHQWYWRECNPPKRRTRDAQP